MRSEILSMTAIQGSVGRVSRRRAVRSFDGSALGLPAGYESGNSGQGDWGGFSGVSGGVVFPARAVGGVLV